LLYPGANSSLQNRVKIDEEARPQHPVDFFFPRRIINLIRPAAELAGALNSSQHIRPPKPSPFRKGCLGDNIHTPLERREGFGYGQLIIKDIPQVDN
jgi:hypothetical protein